MMNLIANAFAFSAVLIVWVQAYGVVSAGGIESSADALVSALALIFTAKLLAGVSEGFKNSNT